MSFEISEYLKEIKELIEENDEGICRSDYRYFIQEAQEKIYWMHYTLNNAEMTKDGTMFMRFREQLIEMSVLALNATIGFDEEHIINSKLE